jgi:CTP:molybdopterin cytidylyltransferase MocA
VSDNQTAPPASRHGRTPHVRGLVLAAGAGRRMGAPKALVRRRPEDPTLVERAVDLLHAGGCSGMTVVVGAAAEEVTAIVTALGRDIDVVTCPHWEEGMGASLRCGLAALARTTHEGEGRIDAVLVTLVDLPDLVPEVVARVLDGPNHDDSTALRRVLRRAAYGGRPGHPALLGRDHWHGVAETSVGDHGARQYYRATPHELVECGDLASGHDADTPAELAREW